MIPIYRAKKIDSNEWVEGYVVISGENDIDYYICPFLGYQEQIDPNTLAIHFPNLHIKDLFFGLDKYIGASEVVGKFYDGSAFKGIAMFNSGLCKFYDKNDDWILLHKLRDIEVIGIHKG